LRMQCAVAEQAIDALDAVLDAVLDGNLAVHPRPRLLKVSVLPPLHWSIVLRGCAGSSWPASGVTWSGHAWWGLLRGLVATRETTKPARHALFLNTTLLIRNKRHPVSVFEGRPQTLTLMPISSPSDSSSSRLTLNISAFWSCCSTAFNATGNNHDL
jgi:hypothetical protein